MRRSLRGLLLLAPMLTAAVPGFAQTVIQGVVTSDRRPVARAEVRIDALAMSVLTNQAGEFILNTAAGRQVVTVRAIGYEPAIVTLQTSEARTSDIEIELRQIPVTLDSLTTIVDPVPNISAKMRGFEERRRLGFGRFLTREALAAQENSLLSDAIRRTGLRLLRRPDVCGGGYAPATARGISSMRTDKPRCLMPEACYMTIYLDGMRIWVDDGKSVPMNIDDFSNRELEAVEVYRGSAEVPAQYMGVGNACGVVLLYTREK